MERATSVISIVVCAVNEIIEHWNGQKLERFDRTNRRMPELRVRGEVDPAMFFGGGSAYRGWEAGDMWR